MYVERYISFSNLKTNASSISKRKGPNKKGRKWAVKSSEIFLGSMVCNWKQEILS